MSVTRLRTVSIRRIKSDRFECPGFLSERSKSLTSCQGSTERSGITDVRRETPWISLRLKVSTDRGKNDDRSKDTRVECTALLGPWKTCVCVCVFEDIVRTSI